MKKVELNNESDASPSDNKAIIIPRSFQDDVVDGLFKINLDQEIKDLSNKFCKYFTAIHIQNNKEYFAIIFEKEFNVSINLMNVLKDFSIKGLNNLVAYSIVTLSSLKESYLVAIVEKYNFSNDLASYIQQNGPLAIDRVEKKLIPSLVEIITQCKRMNISCGNIEPANIIMLDNDNFMLKEFISSYQGFYQSNHYLAPEITECIEVGRQSNDVAIDIYAIGVTVFHAITGAEPWDDYKNIYQYNEDRFAYSTFKLLVNKHKISDRFRIFLKWTMHDDASFRWQLIHINEWLIGNLQKVAFERSVETTNILAFNGRNYSNLQSIAHALFCNWEEALDFIQEDKLLKWMQRHNLDNNLINRVQKLIANTRFAQSFMTPNLNEWNDKLIELLLIIDPKGPIRQRGIAFSINSIPNVLHYLLVTNRKLAAEKILQTLQSQDFLINNNLDKESERILRSLLNDKMQTSNLEWIVYKLNPSAICLSPVLSSEYVTNLSELLISLDKIAVQVPSKFFIDQDILAFIKARAGMNMDSSIKLFSNFPQFSDNPFIYGLCLLNIVQNSINDIKIPNVCNILVSKIIDLFNNTIHNLKFKNELEAQLTNISAEGDLSKVVRFLTDQTKFINDYNGYYRACKEIDYLRKNIRSLAFEGIVFDNALIFSQKLTVLISYLLCFIVTMILIM